MNPDTVATTKAMNEGTIEAMSEIMTEAMRDMSVIDTQRMTWSGKTATGTMEEVSLHQEDHLTTEKSAMKGGTVTAITTEEEEEQQHHHPLAGAEEEEEQGVELEGTIWEEEAEEIPIMEAGACNTKHALSESLFKICLHVIIGTEYIHTRTTLGPGLPCSILLCAG